MDENLTKFKRTNCFEKVTPETVKKFQTILKKGVEFYGFLNKKGLLADVRTGHPTYVAAEIIPQSDCEWHSHPQHIGNIGQMFGMAEEQQKQIKCSVNSEKIRTSIVSEDDSFIAFLRPWTIPAGSKDRTKPIVTSMIVTNEGLIQYYLGNENKWAEFLQEVDEKYGKNSEIDRQTALRIEGNKIMNEAMSEIYEGDGQDFSYCGDEKIWKIVKEKWHQYLRDRTGLVIDFWTPSDWKPPKPKKDPLQAVADVVRQMFSALPAFGMELPKNQSKSPFNTVLGR